jgi:hypothetical protein
MPEPAGLRLHTGDGLVVVTCGRSVLYRYDADDTPGCGTWRSWR